MNLEYVLLSFNVNPNIAKSLANLIPTDGINGMWDNTNNYGRKVKNIKSLKLYHFSDEMTAKDLIDIVIIEKSKNYEVHISHSDYIKNISSLPIRVASLHFDYNLIYTKNGILKDFTVERRSNNELFTLQNKEGISEGSEIFANIPIKFGEGMIVDTNSLVEAGEKVNLEKLILLGHRYFLNNIITFDKESHIITERIKIFDKK